MIPNNQNGRRGLPTEELKEISSFIGYIGVIAGVIAAGFKWFYEFQKIKDGVKCQLRSEMLHIYYKNVDLKTVRQFELQNFILLYEAYKALRGNSFVDEINEEVRSWTVIT